MSSTPPRPGGDLELVLLSTLWERQCSELTVRDLYESVGRPRGIVYTTVAKVLDRMVDKGLVARKHSDRVYLYRPLVKRSETQRTMVRDVLARIIGKDHRPAVAALVGALEDVSPDLLDDLAAEIAARKEEGDGT